MSEPAIVGRRPASSVHAQNFAKFAMACGKIAALKMDLAGDLTYARYSRLERKAAPVIRQRLVKMKASAMDLCRLK